MPSSKKNKDSKQNKVSRGRKYEQLAADFFIHLGFRMLAQNWRAGKKEIDLIVQKDNLIVFVEVKSSSTKSFGHPSERVDKKKIKNLSEAAGQFVMEHNIRDVDLRFDVVTFINGNLEHFPNAFEAVE